MKHVPYKGSVDVMQAMLAGAIGVFSDQPNIVPPYSLTPIAVFAGKRLPGCAVLNSSATNAASPARSRKPIGCFCFSRPAMTAGSARTALQAA